MPAGEWVAAAIGGVSGVVLDQVVNVVRDARAHRRDDAAAARAHVEHELEGLRQGLATAREEIAELRGGRRDPR